MPTTRVVGGNGGVTDDVKVLLREGRWWRMRARAGGLGESKRTISTRACAPRLAERGAARKKNETRVWTSQGRVGCTTTTPTAMHSLHQKHTAQKRERHKNSGAKRTQLRSTKPENSGRAAVNCGWPEGGNVHRRCRWYDGVAGRESPRRTVRQSPATAARLMPTVIVPHGPAFFLR